MASDFTSVETLFSCSYMSVSACRDIAALSFTGSVFRWKTHTSRQYCLLSSQWNWELMVGFKSKRVLLCLSGALMGEFTVKQSTESPNSHTPFPLFLGNDQFLFIFQKTQECRNAKSIKINRKQESNQLDNVFVSLFVSESLLSPSPGEKFSFPLWLFLLCCVLVCVVIYLRMIISRR